MTLIDFEELMEMYNNKYQEFNVYDLRFLKKEYLPIVEAIPIDWITAWISSHDEIDGKQMLLDWYKQK